MLRGRHGRLFPAHRRLVHCRAHAHRTCHRRAWHGHHSPPTRQATRRRANDTTFRPRLPIHVLGVRATHARRRATRLNGHRRRLLRQRYDGIFLGHDATRTTRRESMADPRRTCQRQRQRHRRVDRMLVQPDQDAIPVSECTVPSPSRPSTPGQTRITDPTPEVSVLRGEPQPDTTTRSYFALRRSFIQESRAWTRGCGFVWVIVTFMTQLQSE
jgi:hypothetical protein